MGDIRYMASCKDQQRSRRISNKRLDYATPCHDRHEVRLIALKNNKASRRQSWITRYRDNWRNDSVAKDELHTSRSATRRGTVQTVFEQKVNPAIKDVKGL